MPVDQTNVFGKKPNKSGRLKDRPMYLDMDPNESDIFILGYYRDENDYLVSDGWWQYKGDVCVNEQGTVEPYDAESDRWSAWCQLNCHSFDEVKDESGLFIDEDIDPDELWCGWVSPDGKWVPVCDHDHDHVAVLLFGRSESVLERTFIKVTYGANAALVGLTTRDWITEYQKQVLLEKGVHVVYGGFHADEVIWSSDM